MKIYRVSYWTIDEEDYENNGFTFHSNKADAQRALSQAEERGNCIEEFDFPITKQGMLDALEKLAKHPDNG